MLRNIHNKQTRKHISLQRSPHKCLADLVDDKNPPNRNKNKAYCSNSSTNLIFVFIVQTPKNKTSNLKKTTISLRNKVSNLDLKNYKYKSRLFLEKNLLERVGRKHVTNLVVHLSKNNENYRKFTAAFIP